MLRQSLKKLSSGIHSQPILYKSLIQHNKVLPAYSLILNRNASTQTKSEINSPQKTPRRLVEVDSPFAKANLFLYALPEDPYFASEKVARILEIGAVEDAHDYVKALPPYLQSVVVWNQLIKHCANFGKSGFAEKYYSQMRKRGIKPNERTITQMLMTYAKSDSPNAIENAESWFAKLQVFDIEPSIIHYNNLMRVYANAGSPEKTIETLKHIQKKDNIMPDAVSYTIALWSCPNLTRMNPAEEIELIWNDIIYRIDRTERKSTNKPASLLMRKAAKIARSERSIVEHNKSKEEVLNVDDALVMALLHAVGHTAKFEKDKLIAVEVIDRFYSLCPPRAADIMKNNGIELENRKQGSGIQPSVKVMDAILRFSGGLKEFELGKQYFDWARQQYPRLNSDKQVLNSFHYIQQQLKRSSKGDLKDRTNNYSRPKDSNKSSKGDLKDRTNNYSRPKDSNKSSKEKSSRRKQDFKGKK